MAVADLPNMSDTTESSATLQTVKAVLKAVLLTAPYRDEFAAVSCELTQDADVLTGDKAAFDETDTEQVTDPFGILGIVLVSLYSFHPSVRARSATYLCL